jgi:uncharacterized protein (DUF2235 family)
MAVPTPACVTPPIDCHAQALLENHLPGPNAKKIFVFCDGTGNEFNPKRTGDGNSNVVKLYTTLRVADHQVAYYHPGVGTMGDPSIRSPILRFWSMVKGLAFGAGFQANVLDAYLFLMEVYNDGDEIYLFGFSRGAYTARALAGMLHGYGLLCRGNEGHLIYAWNMFHDEAKRTRNLLKLAPNARGADQRAHTNRRNYAFAETYSRRVVIRFMGLWDTVSSVGWIYSPMRLLDMAQNPIVQVGRHAVSIDERRAFYRDNLWGPPVDINDPEWPPQLRDQGICQDLAQVWFPGAHSDIGGSYSQDECAPANETLRWMVGELVKHGAELCQERVEMVLGVPSGFYSADAIYTPPPAPDHCLHNQLKGVWWILQGFPQQYYDKEDQTIQWRVPYGTPRTLPDGSIIHGSAVRRLSSTLPGEIPYAPLNLTSEQVTQAATTPPGTTADFTGCFIYKANPATSVRSGKTAQRYLRLIVGWITFSVFWAAIATVAWYVLGLGVSAAVWMFWLITHTPLLKHLFG